MAADPPKSARPSRAAKPNQTTTADAPEDRAGARMTTSRTLPSRGARLPRVYGYSMQNDHVLFRYELTADTNLAIDSDTGDRIRLTPRDDMDLAVAGDFSGWEPRSMPRDEANRVFQLLVPASEFERDLHQFKFVVDGHLWIEPPWFARNAVPAEGVSGDSKNLLLSLRQEGTNVTNAGVTGFAGSSADGNLERALEITVALIGSAAHGIYARSWDTIDERAAQTLRAAVATDGYNPEEISGINALLIVSGRVSRDIVVAHLPTSTLAPSWIDYIVEGDRFIGKLRTQLG
ncbi:hypothetical protein [Mesorhizobium sp.]|uniref:hypothetical protein n=1 Tax=Mesorhizobium sp. TaxID=1871066 RepID=UPI000FE9A724|nr:hypothetical protein [Mesorhizobium sp.]RWP58620.1 MAG: hypothetical protein EOR08_26620 [Mesorhizobium sp.]